MQKSSGNIKNSTWNLANILIYPIAFLASTPFFINKLGESDFGVWMLINSYVYIAVHIISFGLGNSITVHIAEALGKNSKEKISAYVNSSTKLLGWISIVGILLAIMYQIINILGVNVFADNIDRILVVATIVISVKFWELLYQSILKGYERYDLASIYNIISKLLVLIVQIVVVIMGYGIFEIFISSLILNSLAVVIQGFVTYNLMPFYRFSLVKYTKERDELFHFGFWTWLQTIVSVLAYQIDRFVVASFLGTAVAGYYILASTIINHMHMAFGAIVSWLFPKIARKKESVKNITRYFQTLRGFSIGASLFAVIITFIFYEPVFTMWLGEEKFQKMGNFFRLFLILETYMIMTIVPLFYLNGIKMLKFITSLEVMYKFGAILGMFIAFIILRTAESLIIGQIVALIILIPVEYFFINKRILEDNVFNETFVTILPSILVTIIIIVNQWYLTIGLSVLSLLIFYGYYLNRKRFQIKLLLE
jgi:O-antigen/teichoic acid export membrane protein